MQCKNCGHAVDNRYCPSCGQSAEVVRFDGHYLLRSALDTFDLDRGLLYALLALLRRPGRAIREYVEGHRIRFYNPFKLFLITGAVATFVIFTFGLYGETTGESAALKFLGFEAADAFSYYSSKYLTYFSIAAVPTFSVISWLFFIRSGFNLVENLVMNTYLASGQFVLLCLFAPLAIYFPGTLSSMVYAIVNTLYNILVLAVFFKATTIKGLMLSTVTVMVSYGVMLFVNYFLFISTPDRWWKYLDSLIG